MIEQGDAGWAVVRLTGEIDIANADRIPQQVVAAVASAPAGVVLDMSGVTFIDSTGIGAMIAARNACLSSGRSLQIAAPSRQVQRMLALTGLDDVFAVVGPARC